VPSTQDQPDQDAMRFVAAVGATMAAANYPVTIVRAIMDGTSRAYGLDNEFLACATTSRSAGRAVKAYAWSTRTWICGVASRSRWPNGGEHTKRDGQPRGGVGGTRPNP
jgi:hypothetical protein